MLTMAAASPDTSGDRPANCETQVLIGRVLCMELPRRARAARSRGALRPRTFVPTSPVGLHAASQMGTLGRVGRPGKRGGFRISQLAPEAWTRLAAQVREPAGVRVDERVGAFVHEQRDLTDIAGLSVGGPISMAGAVQPVDRAGRVGHACAVGRDGACTVAPGRAVPDPGLAAVDVGMTAVKVAALDVATVGLRTRGNPRVSVTGGCRRLPQLPRGRQRACVEGRGAGRDGDGG